MLNAFKVEGLDVFRKYTPYDAIVSTKTNHLYLSYPKANAIVGIDISNRRVSEIIKIAHPWKLAYNPVTFSCYAVAANKEKREVILVFNHLVKEKIEVSTGFESRSGWKNNIVDGSVDMVVDAGSNKLYVHRKNSNSVLAFDGSADFAMKEIILPDFAMALAINQTTRKIYVATGKAEILILDALTHQILGKIRPKRRWPKSASPPLYEGLFVNPVRNLLIIKRNSRTESTRYDFLKLSGDMLDGYETEFVEPAIPYEGIAFANNVLIVPEKDRAFMKVWGVDKLYVFDGSIDAIIETIDVVFPKGGVRQYLNDFILHSSLHDIMSYNSDSSKIYLTDTSHGQLHELEV